MTDSPLGNKTHIQRQTLTHAHVCVHTHTRTHSDGTGRWRNAGKKRYKNRKKTDRRANREIDVGEKNREKHSKTEMEKMRKRTSFIQ